MIQTFSYVDSDDLTSARIGGDPPASIDTSSFDDLTQFFGTFPIPDNPARQYSVFHRFEIFGEDEDRDVILHNNRILEPSPLIWVAVHTTAAESSRFAGSPRAFSPKSLLFSDPIDEGSSQASIYTENKIGGVAYADRHQVMEAFASLEHQGYTHLLQIGQDGLIPDGFPWDPGYLNVWCSDLFDPDTYRFCIQQ